MTSQQRALFASVITYGVVLVVALLVAGVALDRPIVIRLAVLVAAGSYLTQAASSSAITFNWYRLWPVTLLLWAGTLYLGAWAILEVIR